MAIAVDKDIDVIVCLGVDDVGEEVGDGTYSGGACESWVTDSRSIFHVCSRRDWFYSLHEVFDGTVTLANDTILPIARVGKVRLRMWDGVVHTVIGVKYVHGV